jgi:AsmA protein
MSGTASFVIEDGEIVGVNIAKMVRSLTSSTLNGWQEDRSEKTDLSQLGGDIRIEGGVATIDNLHAAGPLVRVSGGGSVDLGAKTLQLKLEPKLVMTLQGQGGAADPVGLGVPVMVQGNWSNPKIYPDFAGILDNPDAAFSKLKAMGNGLFGSNFFGKNIPGQPSSGATMPDVGKIIENFKGMAPPNSSNNQSMPNTSPNDTTTNSPDDKRSPPQPQDVQNAINNMMREMFKR